MPAFSFFKLTIAGKYEPVHVYADTQEKAMQAYKIKYPEAEILACEWVTEND